MARAVFGWIDPGGDVRVSSKRCGDRFDLGHRGLSLPRSGPHRGFDIEILDRVRFGLNQTVPDRRAGLEDEAGSADPALDICGGVEDGGPGAGAQGVDFACDMQVSGADDEVGLDLRVLTDGDGSGSLDGGSPVSFFDMDITET